MKRVLVLALLMLSWLGGTGPGRAAAFTFQFTPDPTLGRTLSASGTITTDDLPDVADIVSVQGHVGRLDIAGLDTDKGLNIVSLLDPSALAAYFSFTATRETVAYGPVGYSYAFGPSAFAPYELDVIRGDGRSFTAYGALSIAPAPVSAVPLPGAAPLFGGALLALGAVGYGVGRRHAAKAI